MEPTTQLRRLICYLMFGLMLAVPSYAEAANDELERGKQFVSLIQSFLEVIETTHGIYSDPEKATIFQLHKIQEIYKFYKNKQKKRYPIQSFMDAFFDDHVQLYANYKDQWEIEKFLQHKNIFNR